MSEGNLRGPQEAFTELLRNNISLLRRQFRTGTLSGRNLHRQDPCQDRILSVLPTVPWPQRKPSTLCGSGWSRMEIPVLLDSAYFASFLKQDKLNLSRQLPTPNVPPRPVPACVRARPSFL